MRVKDVRPPAKDGLTIVDGVNSFTAVAQDSLGRMDTNTVAVDLPATVSFTYDDNGSLLSDGRRLLGYDDENQLIAVIVTNGVNNSTLSKFAYDGFGRRRVRTECVWQNGGWATNALVRYVYDGMLVLQERDGNNLPAVTYTRGRDLSGSLQGAGGIGGLLALTLHSSLSTPHFFYHTDGNGNITCVINDKQAVVARYVHEPFGNVLSLSGPLAEVNLYRFSSKESHPTSGLVYYGFRFYDLNLQRWLNRDPIEDAAGDLDFAYTRNSPITAFDPDGLRTLTAGECLWGCAKAHGIGSGIGLLGWFSGLPLLDRDIPKFGGATKGTSIASRCLSTWFPQKIPSSWAPTKPWGKGWRARTATLGRFIGRWVPYLGAAVVVGEAGQIAACVYECEGMSIGTGESADDVVNR